MLVNKEITSVELTQDVLSRIDEVEGDVEAYLTITREDALKQAEAVDKKIAAGEAISFLEASRVPSRTTSARRASRRRVPRRSSSTSCRRTMRRS